MRRRRRREPLINRDKRKQIHDYVKKMRRRRKKETVINRNKIKEQIPDNHGH